MKSFTSKCLMIFLALSLTPFFTGTIFAMVQMCEEPTCSGTQVNGLRRAIFNDVALSRTYLQQLPQPTGGIEGVSEPHFLKRGKRLGGSGNKSLSSLSITYDDFVAHLSVGRDRQVQLVLNPAGIPMDVGGEDVEGLIWQMPDLSAFGTVHQRVVFSEPVGATPYVGDFPGATPSHAFNSDGLYEYYELIPETTTEPGALFYYGAADANYVYFGDYVHAPVPLALGLGVFGGEFDPVPCSLFEDGCGTGNPDEAYYQIFQEFEEVATGTLQTYDNGTTEAIKVRNSVRVVIADENDVILEEFFTDYLIWYSKDGHYLRCELADGASWTDNTSFVDIEYHKLSAGALPVQWREVSAVVIKDREVEVRWATERETDNDRFIVERSLDGTNFQSLGTVPAIGNSSQPEHYKLIDDAAHEGFNYYRIKQMDFGGNSSYSSVVSALVTVSVDGESLTVLYPNPGRDEVFFSRPASYELFGAQGQRLASGVAEGSLDVSGLPAGQYLVRLDGGKLHRWVKQ